MDETARDLGVPGAVVLLRTPQGQLTAAHGTTQLHARTPPGPDTHFRIASNTKTMTAAVILLLAQEGKLALDDAPTANALMLKVLDRTYAVSPLAPRPSDGGS